MNIYHELVPQKMGTSVALGCFDGVHIGHRKVLVAALEGEKKGLCPAVFTFSSDGAARVKESPAIMTEEQKASRFQELGFSALYSVPFSSVREMEPEYFVSRVLKESLSAKRVCCGFNYRFGRDGKGDVKLLSQLCGKYSIELSVAPQVLWKGQTVSSSRIRQAISRGDMREALELLGRPFEIDFPVIKGNQIGRTLGTPTMNQALPPHFILPQFGVYATLVKIDGREYHGVTNVGVKPTVGAQAPLSETWIPGYQGNLYGEKIPVFFLSFLRPEVKFESLELLRRQILEDGERAEEILKNFQKGKKSFDSPC